ncbi:hypothetical protein ACHAXS_012341 [Conticribra weissflogii]
MGCLQLAKADKSLTSVLSTNKSNANNICCLLSTISCIESQISQFNITHLNLMKNPKNSM